MTRDELYIGIRKGEINPNNQELFIGALIKGFLQSINKYITIRKKGVPHFINQTGDPTMMLEVKGQDIALGSVDTTNENYIYNTVPRCLVMPKGINIVSDQVSNPYSKGSFQIEYEDQLVTFAAEYRRIPITLNAELTYIIDSYTDYLELCQQIITNLIFIKQFNIVYMGKNIPCSYQIPTDLDADYDLDFDMNNTESMHKKVNISIEIETNMPVFDEKTVIPSDQMITNVGGFGFDQNKKRDHRIHIYKGIDKEIDHNKPYESV